VTALETDYLVVGAGAMGMAFTDTLVTETDAQVMIVDRSHAPGWALDRAYPFVRLHQPSAYYGVNSRGLGSDSIDQLGWNEGLYELASVGEICAYFERVMHRDCYPVGRCPTFDGRVSGRQEISHAGRRRPDRPRPQTSRGRNVSADHGALDAPARLRRRKNSCNASATSCGWGASSASSPAR